MALQNEIVELIYDGELASFKACVTGEHARHQDGENGKRGLEGSYLHVCAEQNRLEMAEILISLGADVNLIGGVWTTNPLSHGAERGHVQMVKLLRDHGSEFDVSHPRTNPLFMAIEKGHLDVVSYLLDAGIAPNVVYRLEDGTLQNGLSLAVDHRRERVVGLLQSRGCCMPDDGVDLPVRELSKTEANEPAESGRQVIDYMQLRFGPVDELGLAELLPVVNGASVTINIIRPNELHPYFVLFTNGMSDLPMSVPQGQEGWRYAELVLHLPVDWSHPRDVAPDSPWLWPIHWMRKMAYYPHLGKTWLGQPAAIVSSCEPPKPLGHNTSQSCLLMVPDFANLEAPLQRANGDLVHFFTMVPLFTDERDFELEHGMEAFFERFIQHKVPMTVDVNRQSFCATD